MTNTTNTLNIAALLEMHRRTFGSARMETEPPAPGPPAQGDPSPPPAYTAPASQADLDRMINERLVRERGKFADYGDLKAKATRLDQIEAANASDLEKAVKAARVEGETEANQRANSRLVKSEARALAAVAKFRDPTDAVAFLDLTGVKVSDDGEVDGPAVKSLLDDLAKTKPYLLVDETPPPPPPFNGGPRTPGDTPTATTPHGRLRQSIEADIAANARP